MRKLLLLTLVVAMPSFASLSVSPGIVNFGNVEVNSATRTRTVWVRNYGNEPTGVQIYQSFCDSSFWVRDDCYWGLAPGHSCRITIRYRPIYERYDSCRINVEDDDLNRDYIRVSGRGTHRQ